MHSHPKVKDEGNPSVLVEDEGNLSVQVRTKDEGNLSVQVKVKPPAHKHEAVVLTIEPSPSVENGRT